MESFVCVEPAISFPTEFLLYLENRYLLTLNFNGDCTFCIAVI